MNPRRQTYIPNPELFLRRAPAFLFPGLGWFYGCPRLGMRIVSVKVPDTLLEMIDILVHSGRYSSRNEAIRTAIRVLVEKELNTLANSAAPRKPNIVVMEIPGDNEETDTHSGKKVMRGVPQDDPIDTTQIATSRFPSLLSHIGYVCRVLWHALENFRNYESIQCEDRCSEPFGSGLMELEKALVMIGCIE